MDNKPYFLALNRINGIGARTIKKILTFFPDLSVLFRLPTIELINSGLSAKQASAIAQFNFKDIENDLAWEAKSSNHHLLLFTDKQYPTLLKEINDPPPVLYAIGDLRCLEQPNLSIIGTRKPTPSGAETAFHIAKEISQAGINIISGLALGIDAQAHRGCLQAKGKTIAVMGTGVDVIYPIQHRQLAKEISQEGLIISELVLGSPPKAGHFPKRNRIISGLSMVTLVVEAAVKSGSLITAKLALEQNRDVLAIPGSIYNPQARGCNFLIKEGAKIVTRISDILEEFPNQAQKIKIVDSSLSLASSDKNLVKCIGFELTTLDQICQRSGLPHAEVCCNLVDLELAGLIKAVSGGYMRCN